ncbi:MAG TPA: hypothetical protein VFO34_10270 [Candidatus Acidoferrales bacterium]|nr:hypothetical protein [Candidatus Acidoferrales bacterium]
MIDIRLPIGGLFALLGIVLIAFGAESDPSRYVKSLGINIDLYWGIVLLIFGAIMLLLGRRRSRAAKS